MREFDLPTWAARTLVRAGAAMLCDRHQTIFASPGGLAINSAIIAARLNRIAGLSADGAELAVLEVYLKLAPSCIVCSEECSARHPSIQCK